LPNCADVLLRNYSLTCWGVEQR